MQRIQCSPPPSPSWNLWWGCQPHHTVVLYKCSRQLGPVHDRHVLYKENTPLGLRERCCQGRSCTWMYPHYQWRTGKQHTNKQKRVRSSSTLCTSSPVTHWSYFKELAAMNADFPHITSPVFHPKSCTWTHHKNHSWWTASKYILHLIRKFLLRLLDGVTWHLPVKRKLRNKKCGSTNHRYVTSLSAINKQVTFLTI